MLELLLVGTLDIDPATKTHIRSMRLQTLVKDRRATRANLNYIRLNVLRSAKK